MAVVRYIGMFRTAAIVFVLLGVGWLYTGLLTDHRPELRPYVLALGVASLVVGISLFRRAKAAVVLSALFAALVAVCAMLFIPNASGRGILFLIGLAVVTGLYAALSFRALTERKT